MPRAEPTRLALTLALAALLSLFVFAGPGTGAVAFAPAELASATLAPSTATVGDRLTLTLVVTHDEGATVDGPGFGADYGGLEIVDIGEPQTESQPPRAETLLAYTLVAFRTGAFLVPPLPLRVRTAGEEDLVLETPLLRVKIGSVLAPGETELQPLKPQLEIGEDAPSPIAPVFFVAVFAALTALAYALVRRAMQVTPASGPAAPLPQLLLEDRARAALDRLSVDRDSKELYRTLAVTIRAYLSERFDFAAFAMTRRELERSMAAAGVARWPARLTANLLTQCDAVQFAGFLPASARREADLTAAYEIVRLTSEPEPDDLPPRP